MNGFVIFTDIKGYSTLNETQLRAFFDDLLKDLGEALNEHKNKSIIWNTWGDALFAIFEDGEPAVRLALAYRNFFRNYEFHGRGLPPLKARISCDFGEFFRFIDPFDNSRQNAIGRIINRAARIEPVTRPGEIFVSKDFKEAIDRLCIAEPNIRFGELGVLSLAKDYGELEIFRMYPAGERSQQQIDRLVKLDLSDVLPEPQQPTASEAKLLRALHEEVDGATLESRLASQKFAPTSSVFYIELAKICLSHGLYDRAVEFTKFAKSTSMQVDGIAIYPFKQYPPSDKVYANALSRLGEYEEAANVMYGMWRSGHKDADTLSMLAAQYKRRATHGLDGSLLNPIKFDTELLIRARDLYIEAFRRDISQYYPLINAAYLCFFPGSANRGMGIKLSIYITEAFSALSVDKFDDWWQASTVAEAEMLIGDIDQSLRLLKDAFTFFSVNKFQVDSVWQQVALFAHATDAHDEVRPILDLLRHI